MSVDISMDMYLYLYFHAKHCWHELYTEAAPIRASALIPLNFGELLLLDGWRFGYLFAIIMMMTMMIGDDDDDYSLYGALEHKPVKEVYFQSWR